MFRSIFEINENTTILDLGSETGSNIKSVLEGTRADPKNIYIADIDRDMVEEGKARYGFNPVCISETGNFPFEDKFFDIVYCSSVIEHVTVPKEKVWTLKSGKEFRRKATERQKEFANEIIRLGKGYFVQTPYRYYPIESHSWLPIIGWLPRRAIIALLAITNRFWVKRTNPDWYLLNKKEINVLFPGATIMDEKTLGLTKSIMAVYAPQNRHSVLSESAQQQKIKSI